MLKPPGGSDYPPLFYRACFIVESDNQNCLQTPRPSAFRKRHAGYILREENGPQLAEDALRQIAMELGHPDPAAVLEHGAKTLRGLATRGVIGLGELGQ